MLTLTYYYTAHRSAHSTEYSLVCCIPREIHMKQCCCTVFTTFRCHCHSPSLAGPLTFTATQSVTACGQAEAGLTVDVWSGSRPRPLVIVGVRRPSSPATDQSPVFRQPASTI